MVDTTKIAQEPDARKIPDLAKDVFCKIYASKFKTDAESFYEKQKSLFVEELTSGSYAEKLWNTDRMSLYFAFLNLAINGLSLERNLSTQCYLEVRSVCSGKDANGKRIYSNRAVISITGYGELAIRIRAGQIISTGKPIIVYDCDQFQDGEWDGKRKVNYMRTTPRPANAKKIACFFPINLKGGIRDYGIMYTEDVVRLMEYSSKFNRGGANQLYGNAADGSAIDDGFFISKTIKHAFKTYPKIEIGDGAVMEADDQEDVQEEAPTESPAVEQNNNSPFG